MKMNTFKVCVECITFNHAPYILDTLNGFTMQETDFPYVCCIIDDASTDGEQEVIRKYLQENFDLKNESVARNEETNDYVLCFTQHKTNKNCYFVVLWLKYNHYSKKKTKATYFADWHKNATYIALCEGDDYWTNPLKMQRQFDFMEAHPQCSLCFHANYRLLPSGEMRVQKPHIIKTFYNTEDIILGNGVTIATNTMFFRRSLVNYNERPNFWKNSPVGDAPVKLLLASKGLVGYIDETMSIYRFLVSGSWSANKRNIHNLRKHNDAILRMYDEYDKYTNYQFHDAIKKKKRINRRKIVIAILKILFYNIFRN